MRGIGNDDCGAGFLDAHPRLVPRQEASAPTLFGGHPSQPFGEHKRQPRDRVGPNWRMPNVRGKRAVPHAVCDANYWQSFIHTRLAGCAVAASRQAIVLEGATDQDPAKYSRGSFAELQRRRQRCLRPGVY